MRQLMILASVLLSSSCATLFWDRGITDSDRAQVLLQKGVAVSDEVDEDIRKYNEARDFLLRSKAIENNQRVRMQLESLELEIVNCKRQHYGSASSSLSKKQFVTAAVHFQYVFLLRFHDRPEDMVDRYARSLYNKSLSVIQKEINLVLTNAQRRLDAKNLTGAYELYQLVLMADPGNGTANQKMSERRDYDATQARKMFDTGRKYFDANNYDSALYYLRRSLEFKRNDDALNLINRITVAQVNAKYVKSASVAMNSGDLYEALKLYRRCLYNDPSNKFYEEKVKSISERLRPKLESWYSEGMIKYEAGDLESAINYFERVIAVDEGYKDSASLIVKARQKLESLSKLIN